MLSIEPSKNADAAIRYFRENLAQQDYYCEENAIMGQWHGKAADMLQLFGEVQSKDFEALLHNVNPSSGLRLTARNSANRRPMYDCTFSAPKSVSILHALTGDKDILNAHRLAVQKAMAELENNLQTQMGTGSKKHYHTTGNGLFVEFVHETSRPLEKNNENGKYFIPDPQLHSHCTLINATWCEEQKRYRAIEMGIVKSQASYYEALYHSYLGEHLKFAGYALEKTGKRWEIKDFSRELIEKYSGRTIEIEKAASDRGIVSAKAKAKLGRLTRNDKHQSVPDNKLAHIWDDRLTHKERSIIQNAKGMPPNDGGSGGSFELDAKRTIDLSLEHFMERNSSISEKRLLAYAIDLSSGQINPNALKKELSSRSNILSAERNTVRYLTTIDMLDEEKKLVQSAAHGRASEPALNPNYRIQNPILNQEQRLAVDGILGNTDKIMILSGDAGVGKTTLLQEVKNGVEQTGKEIFAFAPSSDASRDVLRKKGFETADTIALLLKSKKSQNQLKDKVMLIDEAGLVGVPTMNQLIDIAYEQNSRVILSGDWKQHSAVEAGDALKILETKSKTHVSRVSEIVRQRDSKEYKNAIARLAKAVRFKNPQKRRDVIDRAFDSLDKQGAVQEIFDKDERNKAIAKSYAEATKDNSKDAIIVSPTHREAEDITKAVRYELKAKKRIAFADRTFERLQSRYLTESEKKNTANYVLGDTVEFHRNGSGFKAGVKYQVADIKPNGKVNLKAIGQDTVKPLAFDTLQSFEVYSSKSIDLAKGDRLRLTKNLKAMDGRNLFNGQNYQVEGFDGQGNIRLSNGSVISKDAAHFNHGYCSTSHASQGRDAKTVILAQSSISLAASNNKQFYVSVSRGIEKCQIFTDDKQALKEAVNRPVENMSAMEVEKMRKEQIQQKIGQMERIRNFYEERIKPSLETIKTKYGQAGTKGKMGGWEPELGR